MNETQAAVELARALTENEKLRQRVAELERDVKNLQKDRAGLEKIVLEYKAEIMELQAQVHERGERMKAMYPWLEWGGFEARQDWNDVRDKWFDPETGEPL